MSNTVYIFVCGSLCSGMVHYGRVAKYVKSSADAKAKGRVYRLPVGYPVYLDEGDHEVHGQVLELEANPVILGVLDEFHGFSPTNPAKSLFLKKTIEVYNQELGEWHAAEVYAINPPKLPRGSVIIDGGDWREELKREPAVTEKLTERQADYIRRLGSSTGREILPINLDLYRELMKLDMIVDKGRRLALSKLGKDVYRYLN